jgi:hypothetical protein
MLHSPISEKYYEGVNEGKDRKKFSNRKVAMDKNITL